MGQESEWKKSSEVTLWDEWWARCCLLPSSSRYSARFAQWGNSRLYSVPPLSTSHPPAKRSHRPLLTVHHPARPSSPRTAPPPHTTWSQRPRPLRHPSRTPSAFRVYLVALLPLSCGVSRLWPQSKVMLTVSSWQIFLASKTERLLAKDTVQVILQDGRIIVVRSFPSIVGP